MFMMFSSETNTKTSSKNFVKVLCTFIRMLSWLCLMVICSSCIVVFISIAIRVLPTFLVLFNNEVPEITRALRSWLTPPFLFVLSNFMIAAILIPSGMFSITEKHPSSNFCVFNHEERESVENTPLEEGKAIRHTYAATIMQKLEMQETFPEQASSKVSKSKQETMTSKNSESALSPLKATSRRSLKSPMKRKVLRSSSSIEPKSSIKNGHESFVSYEIDELHERIEAFIAKARGQMREQEQQASRLYYYDATRNAYGW